MATGGSVSHLDIVESVRRAVAGGRGPVPHLDIVESARRAVTVAAGRWPVVVLCLSRILWRGPGALI